MYAPKSDYITAYINELRIIDEALATTENAEQLIDYSHEFRDYLFSKLGTSYDYEKVEIILHFHHNIQVQLMVLTHRLMNGTITSEDFYTRLTNFMQHDFDRLELAIGKEDFEKLFDMPSAGVAEGLLHDHKI
jgi:hypothetical protein